MQHDRHSHQACIVHVLATGTCRLAKVVVLDYMHHWQTSFVYM